MNKIEKALRFEIRKQLKYKLYKNEQRLNENRKRKQLLHEFAIAGGVIGLGAVNKPHRLNEKKLNRFDQAEILTDALGFETAWNELVSALSDKEFNENFEYIANNHDIKY